MKSEKKKTFTDIESARSWFCEKLNADCEHCELSCFNNAYSLVCAEFCEQYQEEAREIMGVEVGFKEKSFLEIFAIKHGIMKAIVVHEFAKWVALAKRLNGEMPIAFENGKFFVEFHNNFISKMFKFWNDDEISEVIQACEKDGLLITKNFNNKNRRWYAIGDSATEYSSCNKMIDLWAISNDRYGGNHKFIEEREGYMCAICASTKNTVVHHIDGYMPERPENNARNKLILLCKSCHVKVHKNSLRIPNSILKNIGYYDD